MRQAQKQKTSVFSEYENNENDSISSRQLEYWLKQTAPVVQPKFGNQWTLMSTNSIYQQEQHTLVRNQTFESLGKENDPTSFNSLRQVGTHNSTGTKSKSYVNAMLDLQSKIKELQKQNQYLKINVKSLRDDKGKDMHEYVLINQQLKRRIQSLEPKTKKLEEYIHENKKLRDCKEQNTKKMKLLERLNNENKARLQKCQRQLQKYRQTQVKLLRDVDEFRLKWQQQKKSAEKLKEGNNKLQQKNKMLEDMKQKTTTSIIEKYSKSVDMIESQTNQNMQLKQEIFEIKNRHEQILKERENRYGKERQQIVKNLERLKQENNEKKEIVNSMNKEINYFKDKFQKTNEELIASLKKHSQQIRQIKQTHEREKQEWTRQKLAKQKQQDLSNRQSIIKSHINEEASKNIVIQSQLQFADANEVLPESESAIYQQYPKYETRSLGKEKTKTKAKKSQMSKPADTLSQENNHPPLHPYTRSNNKMKSKQIINSKQKLQQKGMERFHQKSRQKSRDHYDKVYQNSNEQSYILKSCEPITQKERPEQLFYSNEPHIHNSAISDHQNIPYYWDTDQIPEFGSQRGNIGSNNYAYNLDKAILIEINREAVRLIQEQQRLLSLSNQTCSPNERAENIGRLKQISQQIRVNNEKIIGMKQKMANS